MARVDLVGGRTTEYHVIIDPLRLQALGLRLSEVTDAFERNNLITPAGMHEENHSLYLTVVDGRLRDPNKIAGFPVKVIGGRPVAIRDLARVEQGPEPIFNIVTADGKEAVLLNIRSQPDGGTLDIALAMTTVVSLLTSLVLAVTVSPSLAAWRMRVHRDPSMSEELLEGGQVLRFLIRIYETAIRIALRHRWVTLGLCVLIVLAGLQVYGRLESEFLPPMDEGGFVIDCKGHPGASLAETDQMLRQAEAILVAAPDVESYSRRTGARLALAIAEPHTGDFLVKLKPSRQRKTADVISDLRDRFRLAVPGLNWELPGILGDLIGDLMWSPAPIEIKLFSTDINFLKQKAPQIEESIQHIRGIVDTFDGLVYTGNSIHLRVRTTDAQRFGLTADQIAAAVGTAMLGQTASSTLEGDRVIEIRVLVEASATDRIETLLNLPIRTPAGHLVKLCEVADVVEEPGQLELRREDMRQDVAVTARLEDRDLGSAMTEIREHLSKAASIPPGTIGFGALYEQQQKSFQNLRIVLAMAIVLVFTVLLIEFRGLREPIAIVLGAVCISVLFSLIATPVFYRVFRRV